MRSSAFELLIVSTLVQWCLASNHYLYHGWLSYGTSYLIITCVIHKIMQLWIMVKIFLGDIELILVSHLVIAVDLHSVQGNRCNFFSEISIMHFAFPLLKINPLSLTFLSLCIECRPEALGWQKISRASKFSCRASKFFFFFMFESCQRWDSGRQVLKP